MSAATGGAVQREVRAVYYSSFSVTRSGTTRPAPFCCQAARHHETIAVAAQQQWHACVKPALSRAAANVAHHNGEQESRRDRGRDSMGRYRSEVSIRRDKRDSAHGCAVRRRYYERLRRSRQPRRRLRPNIARQRRR